MSGAAHRIARVGLLGSALLIASLLLLPIGSARAGSSDSSGFSPRAGVSIVNGSAARIADWPWQVALATPASIKKNSKPTKRFFCGGVVIAPQLVVTAGHCVSWIRRPKVNRIEVISGRTWLNRVETGRVTGVKAVLMPRSPSGKLRYREPDGAALWDVALLVLRQPLSVSPIRLAGPDETGSWSPGHPVWTTGWGTTSGRVSKASPGLRVTRQVMLPDRVCRSDSGRSYLPSLMNCAGGPAGNASSCSGDSGGPLVAPISSDDGARYRLVGLTSFGDETCRGNRPSVFTRIADSPIRGWVYSNALRITGEQVIGSGGEAPPAPTWCRVPTVTGLTPGQARVRLRRNGCSLGRVKRDHDSFGRRGRISATSRYSGWLAPPGFRLRVQVAA